MHLRHRLLSKDLGGPEAEVPQHVRGELLARDPAAGRAHGPLQEALDLRHGAEVEGRVAPVVLGEDVHAPRHEALRAEHGAAGGRLVQRRVPDGVLLVVREVRAGRHEQPEEPVVALEGRPVQRAVLLPGGAAAVGRGRAALQQRPRQRLVAVRGGPDEAAPLAAVLVARVGALLQEPQRRGRGVRLAGLQQGRAEAVAGGDLVLLALLLLPGGAPIGAHAPACSQAGGVGGGAQGREGRA
mmetsp:Transcript_5151/g.16093  ORF Transcript_5151/g.16093 Transcript_5151/m.16093 type:complete len:241 (-) Transcript_5151:5-727(-)